MLPIATPRLLLRPLVPEHNRELPHVKVTMTRARHETLNAQGLPS